MSQEPEPESSEGENNAGSINDETSDPNTSDDAPEWNGFSANMKEELADNDDDEAPTLLPDLSELIKDDSSTLGRISVSKIDHHIEIFKSHPLYPSPSSEAVRTFRGRGNGIQG